MRGKKAGRDGTHILLDEPFPLRPNTKLLVTVLPEVEDDDDAWRRMAVENLQRAYGQDEPEYPYQPLTVTAFSHEPKCGEVKKEEEGDLSGQAAAAEAGRERRHESCYREQRAQIELE